MTPTKTTTIRDCGTTLTHPFPDNVPARMRAFEDAMSAHVTDCETCKATWRKDLNAGRLVPRWVAKAVA